MSHDGAEVPVSLLHRRATPLDGTAPLLLYGYGAYGHAIPAAFSTNRLSLVDRGFVYAIAHIRGGLGLRLWLVSRRQAREEDQHLRRLHRRRRAPDRRALHGQGPDRGTRRQRRRHADGSGREPAPRSLCQHRRRGALRRRAQHHVRPRPAADSAGMAGVGQSHRGRGRLPDHRRLRALRERDRQGLPGDLRDRWAHRPAP